MLAARGGGIAPTSATGVSVGHGPPPAARGGGAAPAAALGLLAGHGPRRATRGRSHTVVATPGLLAGHGPWCAARSRGPAVAAGLRWTWVFGFNFQLVIQNTLVSITTSLGHTFWCNLVHIVKIIIGIFVSYEMEFSKLIN